MIFFTTHRRIVERITITLVGGVLIAISLDNPMNES
jgi:hypothetical protein